MAHWFVAQFCRLATLTKRRRSATQQGWYPPALRWWSLIAAICTCWVFMAFLQIYLFRSNRDGGIIFATSINDLPLRRSFVYLYMPTVIAVLFSIFIVWIDNDAKRFEPYRQMSKPNGALGKNSILLHYPFDFIPFVPLYAFHRRYVCTITYDSWADIDAVTGSFSRPHLRPFSQHLALCLFRPVFFLPRWLYAFRHKRFLCHNETCHWTRKKNDSVSTTHGRLTVS